MAEYLSGKALWEEILKKKAIRDKEQQEPDFNPFEKKLRRLEFYTNAFDGPPKYVSEEHRLYSTDPYELFKQFDRFGLKYDAYKAIQLQATLTEPFFRDLKVAHFKNTYEQYVDYITATEDARSRGQVIESFDSFIREAEDNK